MAINETVLEMHFHRPLMDLIRSTYGLGPNGRMNFYKYSPQRECFVGFDQAYAVSHLDDEAFFRLLEDRAQNHDYRIGEDDRFLGYFLQFKVGKAMSRRMKTTPAAITTDPYYRFSLDTKKNDTTGFSQHELLFKLSRNQGALVYYACPMIFFRDELYEVDIDLDDRLRLADLDGCPDAYLDNASHYIFYNTKPAQPVWASTPKEGTAATPKEFAQKVCERLKDADMAKSGLDLAHVLSDVGTHELASDLGGKTKPYQALGESLTVVHVGTTSPGRQ